MLRRLFLKHATVMFGVAVIGFPSMEFTPVSADGLPDQSSPSYTLFGNKACGCALPRGYCHQGESLPRDVASLVASRAFQ